MRAVLPGDSGGCLQCAEVLRSVHTQQVEGEFQCPAANGGWSCFATAVEAFSHSGEQPGLFLESSGVAVANGLNNFFRGVRRHVCSGELESFRETLWLELTDDVELFCDEFGRWSFSDCKTEICHGGNIAAVFE